MAQKIKLTFVFFISLCSTVCQAQFITPFAIINDKDGFVNVRESDNVKSKIEGKLYNNQVFEVADHLSDASESSDWAYIIYPDVKHKINSSNKIEEALYGYIHKSRIQYLNKLPKLKKKILSADHAEFKSEDISISIKTGKFIPKEHQIKKKDGFVYKIDNQDPWGIDGLIPENLSELKSIEINIKEKVFTFPKENLIGIFSVNFKNTEIYIGTDKILYLTMSNSDGAGSYNIVWTINNNTITSQFIFRDF